MSPIVQAKDAVVYVNSRPIWPPLPRLERLRLASDPAQHQLMRRRRQLGKRAKRGRRS